MSGPGELRVTQQGLHAEPQLDDVARRRGHGPLHASDEDQGGELGVELQDQIPWRQGIGRRRWSLSRTHI